MIEYRGEAFNELLENNTVLVDFFATWCGPCKLLMPVVEEISGERNDVNFYKVDIDQFRQLALSSGVSSVPTLILFKDGKEVGRSVGYKDKNSLNTWLDSFK